MANLGNTGQRYKMSKFAKVEAQEPDGKTVYVTLECGHGYLVLDSDTSYFERLIAQGKKTRCLDCTPTSKG